MSSEDFFFYRFLIKRDSIAEEKKELTGAKEFDDILKDAKKSREKAIQQEEETLKLKGEALKLKKDLE